jgi:hypothetical protein
MCGTYLVGEPGHAFEAGGCGEGVERVESARHALPWSLVLGGRLDLTVGKVGALREEGRAMDAREPPGGAGDGCGARRQEDARHEHDLTNLRIGAYVVNPERRAAAGVVRRTARGCGEW